MSQSAEKLVYRAQITTIAPGQIVSIAQSGLGGHGLQAADGTALAPNLVSAGLLTSLVDSATGDVTLINNSGGTLSDVDVVLARTHTYVGDQDNPFGADDSVATIASGADPESPNSGRAIGVSLAEMQDTGAAVASGLIPLAALQRPLGGMNLAANVITLPLGSYIFSWAVSIEAGATGIFEVQLVADPGGTPGIIASSAVQPDAATDIMVCGNAHHDVSAIASTQTVALNMALTGGAGSAYGHSGASASEAIGGLVIHKVA